MASKFATLGGAALALLLVLSLPNSALARGGGGHGGFGGHGFGGHMGGGFGGHMGGHHGFGPSFGGGHMGGHFHDGHHHGHFRHGSAFFFAPAYGYYDYGYGYGGCYWLRRNALATGSPYWWSRYNACVYGYGY